MKTRSWLALQYPTGAFDLSIREKFRPQSAESAARLKEIVAQYARDESVAFPGYRIGENESRRLLLIAEAAQTLITKDGTPDDQLPPCVKIYRRKNVLNAAREKYSPESASKAVALLLFVNVGWDTFRVGPAPSGIAPVGGNASERQKTVGQIARLLLESWEPTPPSPPTSPRREPASVQVAPETPPDLLAFDAATRKKALGTLAAILLLATFAVAARIVAAKKRKVTRRLD